MYIVSSKRKVVSSKGKAERRVGVGDGRRSKEGVRVGGFEYYSTVGVQWGEWGMSVRGLGKVADGLSLYLEIEGDAGVHCEGPSVQSPNVIPE